MSSISASFQLLCRQCSAPLQVEHGSQYVDCEYCGTTNVVEKGQTVFHYAVRTTLREDDALSALRRWMAGNQTVKGLDASAHIERPLFMHFPMWLVRANRDGAEQVVLEPAAAMSVSELKQMTIPAADLEPYDHTLDDAAVEATVPYSAMLVWLKEGHGLEPGDIREVSLVHMPAYQFKYAFKNRRYTAVVDAASGEVFANIYPSKWETPYRTIGGIAFAVYFLAALVPLIGFLLAGGSGLGIGIAIYGVAAVVLAIPIFVVAATISAKV